MSKSWRRKLCFSPCSPESEVFCSAMTQVKHSQIPTQRDWKFSLYSQGVISGAMLLIEEDERIEPNTLWKELIVSATVRADTYVISCLILSALCVSTGWAFTLCPTSRWPHNKSSILVWGALKRNLCFGDNVNGNPVDIWEIWICTCCAADAANDILVVVVVLLRLESLITGCGTCKTF